MSLKREIETAEIRLHPKDGPSILLWVAQLRAENMLLAFKMSCDPPPAGSGLVSDVFVLILQTEYQGEMYRQLGHAFVGIDATHNTTHYQNLSLFTLIVCDRWGHGKFVQISDRRSC
jgi:hypothetical protein